MYLFYRWVVTALLLAAIGFAPGAIARAQSKDKDGSHQNQNQKQGDDQKSKKDENRGQDRDRGQQHDQQGHKDQAGTNEAPPASLQQGKDQHGATNEGTHDQKGQGSNQQSNRDADRGPDRSQDRDQRQSSNANDDRGRSDRSSGERRTANYGSSRSDRDMSRDRDTSRESSSRHSEKRGPDIGLWFGRGGDGLVIADVSNRGPISRFGFREGDRIVSVNGHRVRGEADFMDYLLHSRRDRVEVVVVRDDRDETIIVEPALLVEDEGNVETDPLERFGVILDDRYDDRIVVWRVIPRSPAYYAGFRPGDVIINFGGHPYHTRTEFEQGVHEWKPGEAEVQVRRGERERNLAVDVPRVESRRENRMERRDTARLNRGERSDSDRSQDGGGLLRARTNR